MPFPTPQPPKKNPSEAKSVFDITFANYNLYFRRHGCDTIPFVNGMMFMKNVNEIFSLIPQLQECMGLR